MKVNDSRRTSLQAFSCSSLLTRTNECREDVELCRTVRDYGKRMDAEGEMLTKQLLLSLCTRQRPADKSEQRTRAGPHQLEHVLRATAKLRDETNVRSDHDARPEAGLSNPSLASEVVVRPRCWAAGWIEWIQWRRCDQPSLLDATGTGGKVAPSHKTRTAPQPSSILQPRREPSS